MKQYNEKNLQILWLFKLIPLFVTKQTVHFDEQHIIQRIHKTYWLFGIVPLFGKDCCSKF